MLSDPKFEYNAQFEELQLTFKAPPGTVNKLLAAIESKKLQGVLWSHEFETDGLWFTAELPWGNLFAQSRDAAFDTLQIGRPFHHSDPEDDLDNIERVGASNAAQWMWPEFLAPLREIMKEIAQ